MERDHRLVAVAVVTVIVLALTVLSGVRLSNRVNIVIVSITIIALISFVLTGLPLALSAGAANLADYSGTNAMTHFWPSLLQATALMFVAFTGYGRIATLGEEVRDPRRTIPRAIIITLWTSALIYIAVACVAVATVGASHLGSITGSNVAPLEEVAR
jgi:APA family basic amino acid/polyamine antiporter